MKLKIKPLNMDAVAMYTAHGHFHDGDCGLDLFILEEVTIEPGETKAIKLGIACETECGKGYMLAPRSSISDTPLRLANSIGIIDGGYRGEIIAKVDNIKNFPYKTTVGKRLFQLVAFDGGPISFELVDTLSETTRGTGGFGSSDKLVAPGK
jgi:dUTP pyrophosphatase